MKSTPYQTTRCGNFQISLWKFKRTTRPNPQARDYHSERTYLTERVCVKYRKFIRYQGWKSQKLYFSLDEFRDLVNALEQLAPEHSNGTLTLNQPN